MFVIYWLAVMQSSFMVIQERQVTWIFGLNALQRIIKNLGAEEKFLSPEKYDVFRFGRKPVAIDIMTKMADFNFDECYRLAMSFKDDELTVPVVHINTLIAAKKKAGRQKDLNDIDYLTNENPQD